MSTETIEKTIEDLEFVRLKIPTLIPRQLIEDVKGRTFTAEQFWTYQTYQLDNPNNYLYVLVDEDRKIHGFLWAQMSTLDDCLWVNTFSISKEYWFKGKAINKAKDFLKEQVKKIKPKSVFWVTTNERFFKKHNFKVSKNVLMEYNIQD